MNIFKRSFRSFRTVSNSNFNFLRTTVFKSFLVIIAVLLTFVANAQIIPGTLESLQGQNGSARREVLTAPSANATSATAGALSQVYSATGFYTLSVDGKGFTGASSTIRVNKPNATATVQKAILMSTVTFGPAANGCVSLLGTPINWNGNATSSSAFSFNSYWADVTGIVAAQMNSAAAGISNLAITECNTSSIDGEALLVVFNDAAATEKTVIIMFGAANTSGDNFSVTLAQPINPAAPGALLDMGLGIGFSFQPSSQVSQVSVNGTRITSSAGGQDDGAPANGALITVGGIGDVNTNPANPNAGTTNPRSDDELYNILPFINNTTTSLNINTLNPSGDDNIFLAYFTLSGAAIIGEGVLLSQTNTTGLVGTPHTVKAIVKNSLGQPISNKAVTFTITSGPNSGLTPFTATTNASGEAEYTYVGAGGVGTDKIDACFNNSQSALTCSNQLSFVWTVPLCTNPVFENYTSSVQANTTATSCSSIVNYSLSVTGTPSPSVSYTFSGATTSSGTGTGSGSIFARGTTNVSVTATNTCGPAISNFTVTVTDNVNPTITCPANVAATTNNGCTATGVDLGTPITSDNCTVASVTNNAPAAFTLGTTTVTWTVTDGSGNTATCIQTVTVTDNINPTITCPANVAATTNSGCTATGVDLGTPITADNCTVASVTNNHPSTTYPLGTTIVTWTVKDGSGNTATCTQTVTVTDNVNPTITCPANRVVAPYRLTGTVVTYATPTVTDNCSVASNVRTAGLASGSVFPIGVTTVTYKVTDGSGNTATCSFTITVIDPYCDNNPNNRKVYVCHNGNTMCISVNALNTHLDHGDILGTCNPTTSIVGVVEPLAVAAQKTNAMVQMEGTDVENFKLVVGPNPSSTDFRLNVLSNTNEAVSIRIFDMSGRTLQIVNKVSKGQSVLVGSALKAGIYFAEANQGNNKVVVKLIKL